MNKMGLMFLFCYFICCFIFISSPFLFMIGDDHVIRYTGADDDIGDAVDTQATE